MEGVDLHLREGTAGGIPPPLSDSDVKARKDLAQPVMLWWSSEKKKKVFFGLLKMDILDWGNDLESENSDIKATTTAYLTEIGVLAALIFTVQVGFLTQPGSGGSFVDENGELEKWMYVLYTGVWATASFTTLCSVLACVALLVLIAKVPDKTETQDPAKYMMIRLGLAGRLPLALFTLGVFGFSTVGATLWLFTALDWMAALFISVGNAIFASLIAIGGGLTMVGALYDTFKAIRSGTIPSSAHMRMRLGTL